MLQAKEPVRQVDLLSELPTGDSSAASYAVDIPIVTDMGSARNNINVLSSDVIIACGMGPGTASEIALAVKNGRKVILLNDMEESKVFLQNYRESSSSLSQTLPRRLI